VEKIEKIVEKSGMFFVSEKTTVNAPRFTTQSPQSHHPKTTFCTRFFQNTPQKHQQKQQNPGSHRGSIFFQENYTLRRLLCLGR
jgi:hypothetical protein